jgi:hypothetical protein
MVSAERVIYVAGTGRNGSTLIGMLLEQATVDAFFAGEITHLWERGLIEGQLCGCGVPLNRCELWTEINNEAFGKSYRLEIDRIRLARDQISSFRRLPGMICGWQRCSRHGLEYTQAYRALIRATSKVTGRSTILDSSKYPTDLQTLTRNGFPPKIVLHLVRDCRAVVHAWKKSKRRTEIHWQAQDMPRYSAITSTIAWRTFNFLIEKIVKRENLSYHRCHYETFVEQFPTSLKNVVADLGLINATASTPHERDDFDGQIGISHSISGNPCRFDSNPIELKLDDAWKSKLSSADRMIVGLLAGAMQRRYGYR